MKNSFPLLAFICLLFRPASAQVPATNELRDEISHYQADQGSLLRKYTLRSSDEYYIRLDQFYKDWLNKLKSLPFDALTQTGKVDYILLRNRIEQDAYRLKEEQENFEAVKPIVRLDAEILNIIQTSRSGLLQDGQRTATLFTRLKQDLQKRQRETGGLPKFTERVANRAAAAIRDYRDALAAVYKFYDEYDPQFSWWMKTPYVEADSALSQYARQLKNWKVEGSAKEDGSGIVGNPIGREELIRNLKSEMIPYSPEELVDLANKEFAWCEAEMLKASREMGLGNDWQAALERVKNDHVEPGKQPELINFLAREATDYVEQNNLVTVDPLAKETWRMTMLTPEQQRYSPFFLGGELLMISFPTSAMPHEDKLMSMRGNNKHFSRATVFHEVIPGHHLQSFMMDRYATHRQLFYTPFWMEGWALYWEMILWDKNFPKSPEDKVGMLFWRMHRCARITFSLNYHLGKWTPQQCIDLLVDKVGHERANATAEVRRSIMGGYGPLYQLAYMVGAKQFYALYRELVNSGKMTEREFHDAVLKNGPIPVEMVRASLTDQPLDRDFVTSWKFIPK